MTIASNLAAIRDRIAQAAQRAGRNPDEIALMAVSKTQASASIIEAYHAGQRLFGENRVQEFADKFPQLADLKDAEFHMIGHLQSNKTAKAAEVFHAVDSIDSAKLALRLDDADAMIEAMATSSRVPISAWYSPPPSCRLVMPFIDLVKKSAENTLKPLTPM